MKTLSPKRFFAIAKEFLYSRPMGLLDSALEWLDQVDDLVPGDVTCKRCRKIVDKKHCKNGVCDDCKEESTNDPR